MRSQAIMTAVAVAACSLGMKRLPDSYDERTIPRCDTSAGPPIGDALGAIIFSGLAVAVAVAGHDAEDGTSKWVGVALSGGMAIPFAFASVAGFGWNSRCQAAIAQWDRRQIEQDTLVQESKAKGPVQAPVVVPATSPRGFFCSASTANPTMSLCVREKSECERAREFSGAGDLSACALVESAWCYSEGRCAATLEACAIQRGRAVAGGAQVGECVETK